MAEKYTLNYKASEIQEILTRADKNPLTLYHDESAKKYRGFASEKNKNLWISNPTYYASLELFNFDESTGGTPTGSYTAEIYLSSSSTTVLMSGEKNMYITYTFDIKNKQGYSSGDSVIATYTFTSDTGSTKSVSEIYKSGTNVSFCVDNYLVNGVNRVLITLKSISHDASISQSVTYNVVNLSMNCEFDFSKHYDKGETFSFNVSSVGEGTKYIETYLDGTGITGQNDYVTIYSGLITKTITLSSSISSGKHTMQVRAYVIVNSTKYYTKTYHYDFAVKGGTSVILLYATTISSPSATIVMSANQYESTSFKCAIYEPDAVTANVSFKDSEGVFGTRQMSNGNVETITYTPTIYGSNSIVATIDSSTFTLTTNITKSNVSMSKATTGLILELSAKGRTNDDVNKDVWTYGSYETSFSANFPFSNRSGWVNNALVLSDGNYINININPLENNVATTGVTIEIDYEVDNGNSNDDATIIDMLNSSSNGILVTPTYIRMKSADGNNIKHLRMTGTRKKIAMVINRNTIDENKGIFNTISNGEIGYVNNYTSSRPFVCGKSLKIGDTTGSCTIRIYSIRVYNRALSLEEEFGNYAVDSGAVVDIANKNDVFANGTQRLSFDKTKLKVASLMIVGNVQTLLNVTDKTTTITASVEFYDPNDVNKYWKATNVIIKNQGTSTLKFPIKNFSFNFGSSKFYNYLGEEITMSGIKLHTNSAPVKKLVAKCDYMESSSSFNTVGAISFNNTGFNTMITDAEGNQTYPVRTNAQKYAVEHNITTDIRSAIDGLPIAMFYRLSDDSDDVCLGQYNLNNGKDDCPEAYGFKGMTGYDVSNTERWELAEEDGLCCFTAASFANFDSKYGDYFECVFPSTSQSPAKLKRLVGWLASLDNGDGTYNQTKFNSEYTQYLDPWKCAHYYNHIFIKDMGVDQVAKNMHLVTEDGNIWFPIYYDGDSAKLNDNDGYQFDVTYDENNNVINPIMADRQSKIADGSYVFQAHDSVLWNCIEGSTSFMSIIKKELTAEYSYGFNYNTEVSSYITNHTALFPQRIINQNAEAKYLSPFRNGNANYLYVSQGRKDERIKLIADRRLKMYEAKWAFGGYLSRSVNFRLITGNSVQDGKIKIKAFSDYWFAYSSNLNMVESGVKVNAGSTYQFTAGLHANGDILRIHATDQMTELDFSDIAEGLYSVETTNTYSDESSTHLKKLILGDGTKTNSTVTQINGLGKLTALEYLDIRNFSGITSIDKLPNLKNLYASGSSLAVFEPTDGISMNTVVLPSTITDIKMKNVSITTFTYTYNDTLSSVTLNGVESTFSKSIATSWTNAISENEWSIEDKMLTCTNVDWKQVSPSDLIAMKQLWGDNLVLKGKIELTSLNEEQANTLTSLFGQCFSKKSELFCYVSGVDFSVFYPSEIVEGNSASIAVIAPDEGDTVFILSSGEGASISNVGVVSTTETGSNRTLSIQVRFYPSDGGTALVRDVSISVNIRTYPRIVSIDGNSAISETSEYQYTLSSGTYTGQYKSTQWSLTGDAVTQGMLTLSNSTSNKCRINVIQNPEEGEELQATLKLQLLKGNGTYAEMTKTITLIEGDKIIAYRNGEAKTAIYDDYTNADPYSKYTSRNSQMTTTGRAVVYSNGEPYMAFAPGTGKITIKPTQDCTFGFYTTKNTNVSITLKCSHSDIGNKYITAKTRTDFKISLLAGETYAFDILCSDTGGRLNMWCPILADFTNVTAPSGSNVNNPLLDMAFDKGWLIKDGINLWKSDAKNVSSISGINKYTKITTFNEFEYFTSIKELVGVGIPSSIVEIKLPSKLTSIGYSTFNSNINLYRLTIPDTVTSMSLNMCGTINTMHIGKGVTKIEKLQSITTVIENFEIDEEADLYYEDGIFYNKSKTKIVNGGNYSGFLTIPSSVKTINEYAFSYSGLTGVVIPNSVTSMGTYVFQYSENLTSVTFEASCNIISGSFYSCTNLSSVEITSTVATYIGSDAFQYCRSLVNIMLPSNIISVGSFSFYGCTSLSSITMYLLSIDYYAFAGCCVLKSIIWYTKTLRTVDERAFGASNSVTGDCVAGISTKGQNVMYIPEDSTSSIETRTFWTKYLSSSSYSAYTLSKTLPSQS